MRKAGFATVAIFLPRRMRNGSTFWLTAVGIVSFQLYLSCILVFAGLFLGCKALESRIYSENYVECTYEEDTEHDVV